MPADETEEENKALYERLKKEIADGHPVDEYNNEVLCRLTPLQQKEVGIPAFYIRPVVPRLKSTAGNRASSTCLSAGPVSALRLLWLTS